METIPAMSKQRSPAEVPPAGGRLRWWVAASTSVVLVVGLVASCSDQKDALPDQATTTTVEATTTSSTTTSSTTTLQGIAAPPGRLPAVDATAKFIALFPTPISSASSRELATELTVRLRSSFEAVGFSADLRGLSLVVGERPGRAPGSLAAYVVEVRNREASGDDTTPGYDIVATLELSDSGRWTITKVEEQRICSRGVSTIGGQPVCL